MQGANNFNFKTFQKTYWADISEDIMGLNPELAEIINNIFLNSNINTDKLYFYKAQYAYGDSIVHKGRFYLPIQKNKNNSQLIDLKSAPQTIQDDLSYNLYANPAGIQLSKISELYVEVEESLLPFSTIQPGRLFGFSRVLDASPESCYSHMPFSLWDISAGSRCAFFLPKVSDTVSHRRLQKKYLIQENTPKSLRDHWSIFKALSNAHSQHSNQPWASEILFFSRGWIDALNTPEFVFLKLYCLTANRSQFSLWRNMFAWNLTFSRICERFNLKENPYVLETIKHVFAVAMGLVPGYQFARSEDYLPYQFIQTAYEKYYDLKGYAPLILHAGEYQNNIPSYYSLQIPNIETRVKRLVGVSFITILEEIRHELDLCVKALSQGGLDIEQTPLESIVQKVQFQLFHPSPARYQAIQNSRHISEYDSTVKNYLLDYPDKQFSYNAPFLKGVVGVKNK